MHHLYGVATCYMTKHDLSTILLKGWVGTAVQRLSETPQMTFIASSDHFRTKICPSNIGKLCWHVQGTHYVTFSRNTLWKRRSRSYCSRGRGRAYLCISRPEPQWWRQTGLYAAYHFSTHTMHGEKHTTFTTFLNFFVKTWEIHLTQNTILIKVVEA